MCRGVHTILLLIGDVSIPGSTGTEGKSCSWTASQSSSNSRGTWSREGKVAERSAGATAAGLWTAGVCKSQSIVMVPELLGSNPAEFSLPFTFFSAGICTNFCCPGKLLIWNTFSCYDQVLHFSRLPIERCKVIHVEVIIINLFINLWPTSILNFQKQSWINFCVKTYPWGVLDSTFLDVHLRYTYMNYCYM